MILSVFMVYAVVPPFSYLILLFWVLFLFVCLFLMTVVKGLSILFVSQKQLFVSLIFCIFLVSISVISVLIFIIYFILLILLFICSSFCSSYRHKVRLLIWDLLFSRHVLLGGHVVLLPSLLELLFLGWITVLLFSSAFRSFHVFFFNFCFDFFSDPFIV